MIKQSKRRQTRAVKIGNVRIGSGNPIAIQSMVKVQAKDVSGAVGAINALAQCGCDIVRIAIEDQEDARAIKDIKRRIRIPLVADIHFNYRLALEAIESGVDKVRLNPGNIYKPLEVRAVIDAAKSARIPIRIGANSGSLRVSSGSGAHALVRSVLEYIKIFKKEKFHQLVISLKASGILETIAAYQEMSRLCEYPLHLGVTATGLPLDGVVKSSAGLGLLLFQGIGDTIRVSLLGDPAQEVQVAKYLLSSLGLRRFGPELICCPTCGRCEVDLLKKAENFELRLNQLTPIEKIQLKDYKIALMGCVVNGPGEARDAHLGIAFSKYKAVLFRRGQQIRTVSLDAADELLWMMLKKELKNGKGA